MNKETTIKQVRAVLEKDPQINLHRYLAEEDDDDELSDAVRLALEKDPTQPRSASTTKGLDPPLVPNEAMKQMAERDAWYVLGSKRSLIA